VGCDGRRWRNCMCVTAQSSGYHPLSLGRAGSQATATWQMPMLWYQHYQSTKRTIVTIAGQKAVQVLARLDNQPSGWSKST
jgi:hypothetical protein